MKLMTKGENDLHPSYTSTKRSMHVIIRFSLATSARATLAKAAAMGHR
jgi:hypothetical protein